MTGTRALTLHQPYAQLVAVGTKTIETRSWPAPADAIGERLLIHAAARMPSFDEVWPVMKALDEQGKASFHASFVAFNSTDTSVLPRRAIVASCTLTDCVPILRGLMPGPDDGKATCITSREGDGGNLVSLWTWDESWNDWRVKHFPERDFGLYEPGRWAWLLGDVKPTTERCPACWGAGWRCDEHQVGYCPECDDNMSLTGCPVCRLPDGGLGGKGRCEPVPAKGRQRLWRWTP